MTTVSGAEALQTIATVSVDDIQNITQELQKNPGFLKDYFSKVPEKLMNLGLRILLVLVVFFVCHKLIRFLRGLVGAALVRTRTNENAIRFIDSILKWFLYGTLILVMLVSFGMDAATVVAILGSLGVTIGLALQGSLSNLAGGILLLILKPFVAGDYIKEHSGNITGTVQEVSIFYTTILTDNNYYAMIPNGSLSNSMITNYSRVGVRRLLLEYSISYTSDLLLAKKILTEIVNEEELSVPDGMTPTEVYVKKLDDSAVVLGVRGTIESHSNLDFHRAIWRINEQVKLRFDEAGIVIPFPQLTLSHLEE
ncbi:MAG: mechanosensitive ion channel family protein [Lachnospiraceae bacterium]|nr:mechanosensitive ion channel family protein [Lachnospiraceae bacterium]